MNDYEGLHEKEIVTLKASTPLSRKELHKFLISSGFKSEDEYYYIDRRDKTEPWQAISILSLDIFFKNEAIYEIIEDFDEKKGDLIWDSLEASYLLASLPQNCIDEFCNKVFLLANQFGLKAYHRNTEVDEVELSKIFIAYAMDLTKNYSEPGSEDLGILIHNTYPR